MAPKYQIINLPVLVWSWMTRQETWWTSVMRSNFLQPGLLTLRLLKTQNPTGTMVPDHLCSVEWSWWWPKEDWTEKWLKTSQVQQTMTWNRKVQCWTVTVQNIQPHLVPVKTQLQVLVQKTSSQSPPSPSSHADPTVRSRNCCPRTKQWCHHRL